MNDLNDLPRRDKNHQIEAQAEAAFLSAVASSGAFFAQVPDRRDYGSDIQLEVADQGRATNIRVHVQLKGTEKALNSDGSVSIEISRANLNYLMMNPYSCYVCYHLPTKSLRICPADSVRRKYDHRGKDWTDQQTLTVTFLEPMSVEYLAMLASLAKASAMSLRDKRVAEATARAEDIAILIKNAPSNFHVPEDAHRAAEVLSRLYGCGEDAVISGAFEKYVSVLGPTDDAMSICYMAEINLGMAGKSQFPQRIIDGIKYLREKLDVESYSQGSLYYSIGNGFSALNKDKEAVVEYENALKFISSPDDSELLAQCLKNIGSSFEKLGDTEKATGYYREALQIMPHLAEAHYALGRSCHRAGRFEEALDHFDKVVFSESSLGSILSVAGWRINVLFNLADGKSAFRELNMLLGHAGDEAWIWPWCATQVASFGRTSLESARLSMAFWERYLRAHTGAADCQGELLLTKFYLRSHGQDIGASYDEFKRRFDFVIDQIRADAGALLWDRLGHWAQDEGNWMEAERCFRKAYDFDGGHYGYCLGTALNFLGRYEESLPILLSQAEEIQPDDMSWFQVAAAHEHLGQAPESIAAYQKAISLNDGYDLAWFNLGGVHWNSGDKVEAIRVWKIAIGMFPDHELAHKLRRDLSEVLN